MHKIHPQKLSKICFNDEKNQKSTNKIDKISGRPRRQLVRRLGCCGRSSTQSVSQVEVGALDGEIVLNVIVNSIKL